jgi:CheY-like chemotaxis protein
VTPPGEAHVLVVDDDDGIREMLQSSLSFAGFRVTTAPDAQTALTLFGTDDPDAIVLDVMMPGSTASTSSSCCGTVARPCRCCSCPRATPWRTASAGCGSVPTTT